VSELASTTRRGWAGLAHADPALQAFVAGLVQSPLPDGVAGWAIGHTTRDAADQAAELAAGRSNAEFGESPHNYQPSMAVDVWPIDNEGNVLDRPDAPEGYRLIAELAEAAGLTGGFRWGWDFGHVELSDWRDRVETWAPPRAGSGTLLALLLGALLLLVRT